VLTVDLDQFASYRIGNGYNYVPMFGDSDLRGTEVAAGAVTAAVALSDLVSRVTVELDETEGGYNLGEILLLDPDDVLISLLVSPTRIAKRDTGSGSPNVVVVEVVYYVHRDELLVLPYWHVVAAGDPVVYAYEAAVDDGFSGTVDEWALEQLELASALPATVIPEFDPDQFHHYKLGDAYNYVPLDADLDVRGQVVHTDAVSEWEAIGSKSYRVWVRLDATVGPFEFGEIGLYRSTGELICLATVPQLLQKTAMAGLEFGNAIDVEILFLYDRNRYETRAFWNENTAQVGALTDVTLEAQTGLTPDHEVVSAGVLMLSYTLSTTLQQWHGINPSSKQDTLGYTPAAVGANVSIFVNDALYVPEAPADGQQYARKDGAWDAVEGFEPEGAAAAAMAAHLAALNPHAQYVPAASVGQALGVAPLGADGKLETSFLPASVLGQVEYKALWDASLGSPPSVAPEKGWYYIVSVAGSTSLSGVTDWKIGDWAIYDGAAWGKVDNTDAVSSVAGLVGVITAGALQVAMSLENVNNTSDMNKPVSTAQAAAIAGREPALAAGTTAQFYRGDKTWTDALDGPLVIGTSTSNKRNLYINRNLTGGVVSTSVANLYAIQSDVTTSATGYISSASTQAAAFTCGSLYHYYATQGTIGAGSAVTNQYGFVADALLTGATNNYGFWGNIAAGTNRWNFYAAGTAPNYFAGQFGLGTTSITGYGLRNNLAITGATTAYGIAVAGTVQSDVTSTARCFQSTPAVAIAPFVLSGLYHFIAQQGTFGAGSVVTSQYGFGANSTLTGAAANYGFFTDLAAELQAGALSYTARTITNVEVVSNVATVTTSAAHGFVVGQSISHSVGTNTQLNGNRTIASTPTATTYTFAITTADVASAVDTGTSTPVRNWAFYASGTAPSYFGGRVGIGAIPINGVNLYVSRTLTGATTSNGVYATGVVQSDVTSGANYFVSVATTQAAAFTLSNLRHYYATQSTIGAGSTVTSQYGFVVDSTLIGATNNYGFASAIAAGANRYNFYASGTADNYFAGRLGLGSVSLTGYGLRNSLTITGAITSYGIAALGVVQSDVTTAANYYTSTAATQAAAFTCGNLRHYYATQGTIGAGSAVTNQYGFLADSTLTGATNNYGFASNIAAGTGRYNFYASGTADNYFAGRVGIGVVPANNTNLHVNKTVTGNITSYGFLISGNIQSDVTTATNYISTSASTQAASFTISAIRHFFVQQGVIGAGSTVTTQYGFAVDNSLTGATANYGFFGNLAASGTARWNFYANNTAPNFLSGQLVLGAATLDASAALNIISTTQGVLFPRMTTTQRDAISSPTAGLVIYNSTTGKLNVRTASAWEAVTSA
jgi:hypothetical protein